MTTPAEFATALLRRMSLPESRNNLVSLVAFVGIEGGHWGNSARFNPFNTTMIMPGSTRAPGTIVQAYTSWTQGIEATARTLTNGLYGSVIQALRQSVDPQTFLRVLSDSPWCSAPSTVADRAPECAPNGPTPCYCNYAKFSANALYQNWANRSDGGGSMSVASSFAPNLAVLLAIAILLGVVWYKWGRE